MDVEDELLVPNRSEIGDNELRKTVKCVITEQNQEVNRQPAGVFVRSCHHSQSSPSTEMREKLSFMQNAVLSFTAASGGV